MKYVIFGGGPCGMRLADELSKKGEKVDIDFPTEKSIFEFLGMKYKEPKQREGYK